MPKVTSSTPAGHAPASAPADEPRESTATSPSSSRRARDANLEPLARRTASNANAAASRRRARAPQQRDAAQAPEDTTPPAARTQPAPNAADGGWMKHLWKGYVGALALGAGYGVYHGRQRAAAADMQAPTPRPSRPAPPTQSAARARVDLPTLYQARANVLERYGEHIPADSDCRSIEPRLTSQLPMGTPGLTNVQYVPGSLSGAKVLSLMVDKTLPRELGTHIAQHEYLHCFANPKFHELMLRSGRPAIEEGLAQYFTEHFPEAQPYRGTMLDNGPAGARLTNGKSGVQLAAELERTVGKDTLHRAYFGGEADAIAKMADAIYQLWPKAPTPGAWLHLSRWNQERQHALAECYVGVALLHTDALPDEALGRTYPVGLALPVDSFSQIGRQQRNQLRDQAARARKALGPNAFDRAFCATNPAKQEKAMNKLVDELARAWKPVLM